MGTLVIADIDGMGTSDVLAKFTSGGVIANSSVTDNGTVVNVLTSLSVNGSIVCTADNGVCVGGGTTYINTTNNITTYINITNNITNEIINNITNNISSGIMEVNLTESGSTIQLTKQYADGNIRIDNITDTSGSGGLSNGSGANFTQLYIGNQTVKTYTTRNMTRANQNYTNSSNYSIQRVLNLSLTLSPLTNYKIHCDILVKTTTATTGQRLVINYTDLNGNKINTTTSIWAWTKMDSATVMGSYNQVTPNGSNFLTTGGSTAISQSFLNGFILTNGNITVINYWMASELAVANAHVNVTQGSECEARIIENI